MARTKGGTLNPVKKEIYNSVYEEFKFHRKVYKSTSDEKVKTYHIRQVESSIGEAGINGYYSKLISVNAFKSKIKKYKGKSVSKAESVSLEHPITYRNIAKYLLNKNKIPTKKEFFKFWLENLFIVKTTLEENIRLKEYQKDFDIMKDNWVDMYKKAKIKLIDDVDFKSHAVKKEYGIK
jgi:hypothetical protein